MGMTAIPLKDLKADTYFNAPVFIDDTYIILSPETPLTQALIHRLAEWEIREVYTTGVATDGPTTASEQETAEASPDEEKPTTTKAAGDRENLGKVSVFYDQFIKYVDTVFSRYVTKNEILIKELSDRVKTLCDVILDNKRYVQIGRAHV